MSEYRAVSALRVSALNSRKSAEKKGEDWNEFVESIRRTNGPQVPLLVRPSGEYVHGSEVFDVIDGGRRLEAAKEIGLKRLPTVVTTEKDAVKVQVLSATLNIMREGLTSSDRLALVNDLLALEKDGKRVFETDKDVLEALAKGGLIISPQRLAAWRSEAELPRSVQKARSAGKLKARATEAIGQGFEDAEEQEAVAETVMEAAESASGQEEAVKAIKRGKKAAAKKQPVEKDEDAEVERVTKKMRDELKDLLSKAGQEKLHRGVDKLGEKDVAGYESLRNLALGMLDKQRENEAPKKPHKVSKDAVEAAANVRVPDKALKAFADSVDRVLVVLEHGESGVVQQVIEKESPLGESILRFMQELAKENAGVKELSELPVEVSEEESEDADKHGVREDGERVASVRRKR